MSDLNPCPCGQTAFVTADFGVWCERDGCLQLPSRADRGSAIAAWNALTRPAPEYAGLVERLKRQAIAASEAQRWLAESKSLRQESNPEGRTDLYMFSKPEQTLEHEAATALTDLTARNKALEAEVERLREALGDLLSWFPDKPQPTQWHWTLQAGERGADDAIEAARAALGARP